jgi:hypothetical protein
MENYHMLRKVYQMQVDQLVEQNRILLLSNQELQAYKDYQLYVERQRQQKEELNGPYELSVDKKKSTTGFIQEASLDESNKEL